MRLLLVAGAIAMGVLVLPAEDFSLNYLGANPITLHTALTYEGRGERLVATAKNESAQQIRHAKICIVSGALSDICLFELWNTEPWAPGAEITWSVTSDRKVPSLAHDATLQQFDSMAPKAPVSPLPAAPAPVGLASRPAVQVPTDGREVLTNEILIKLAKAGLGDEVIIGMIASQPGKYSRASTDIIAMKEAGVSDRVIATILNSTAVPSEVARPPALHVEEDSRLYIAPMESNLNDFIAAEIVKQKIPVVVVLQERDADYILTGLSQKTEVKWYDVVSGSIVGGKDRLEASAKLVRVKDKTFVWAAESGDRSLIFGALKRGGQRKLAERIVRKLKQDLF